MAQRVKLLLDTFPDWRIWFLAFIIIIIIGSLLLIPFLANVCPGKQWMIAQVLDDEVSCSWVCLVSGMLGIWEMKLRKQA